MLQRVDKLAPYALMLILGYLTYSTIESRAPMMAQGKEPPSIGKKLLNPELITPQSHASPADRDPFEVTWDSYLERGTKGLKPTQSAPETNVPENPTSKPVITGPPKMPGRLVSVIVSDDLRLAVIGDSLYHAGMLIGGMNPKRCWTLESIGDGCVTIAFGDLRRTLRLHSGQTGAPRAPAQGDGDGG